MHDCSRRAQGLWRAVAAVKESQNVFDVYRGALIECERYGEIVGGKSNRIVEMTGGGRDDAGCHSRKQRVSRLGKRRHELGGTSRFGWQIPNHNIRSKYWSSE